MNFAEDGYNHILILLGVSVLSALFFPLGLWLFLPLLALVAWFYRDPNRFTRGGDKCLVSPADGEVVEILEAEHPYTGRALKVGIFMNLFSVHVNRMPSAGKVEFLQYVPGQKWFANAEKASEVNERMYVGYRSDAGRVMIVQIAGLLARRIVCRLRRGQLMRRGARFGMIKLGSKVDVYLPLNVKCTVKVGQKVLAGETVIGEVK